MNFLNDVISYIRRIVKTPSNASLSDNLIIDYINRFVLMDSDAIFQLFDYKTKWTFQTQPGITHYNIPLYNTTLNTVSSTNNYPNYNTTPQPGNQVISYYPVYQGFFQPAFVNGIQVPFYTDRASFYNIWPLYVQALNNTFFGDGVTTSFSLTLPNFPALTGYTDITGVIAAGSSTDPIVAASPSPAVSKANIQPAVFITSQDANGNLLQVNDTGQFLNAAIPQGQNMQLGLLTGNITQTWNSTTNVVNYVNGQIKVTFSAAPANEAPINLQCFFFQQGIPRAILFYNNCVEIMPPPNTNYQIELNGYLSPAAFLSTSTAIPFAYMAEYIARGAARKILSDTGDVEQFAFYEPLFKEQRDLVWKRSQRINTSQRTGTIFSEYSSQSPSNNYAGGGN